MCNRITDVVLAMISLLILLPLFLVTVFLIYISSGAPVFFFQKRVGLGGREFSIIKFRTMTVLKGSENGQFDPGSTRRVTAFGRLLRRTKLDELPQLWNVLRGDMSVIGPRPEIRKWVDAYPNRWANILTVRPGLTDPASIKFRNEEELLAKAEDPENEYRFTILPQKLDLYEQYVRTKSFSGDLRIIAKTIFVVFRG